jgi:hypothetical protein
MRMSTGFVTSHPPVCNNSQLQRAITSKRHNVHVLQPAPLQDEAGLEHITDDLVLLMSESVILPGVASKTRSGRKSRKPVSFRPKCGAPRKRHGAEPRINASVKLH